MKRKQQQQIGQTRRHHHDHPQSSRRLLNKKAASNSPEQASSSAEAASPANSDESPVAQAGWSRRLRQNWWKFAALTLLAFIGIVTVLILHRLCCQRDSHDHSLGATSTSKTLPEGSTISTPSDDKAKDLVVATATRTKTTATPAAAATTRDEGCLTKLSLNASAFPRCNRAISSSQHPCMERWSLLRVTLLANDIFLLAPLQLVSKNFSRAIGNCQGEAACRLNNSTKTITILSRGVYRVIVQISGRRQSTSQSTTASREDTSSDGLNSSSIVISLLVNELVEVTRIQHCSLAGGTEFTSIIAVALSLSPLDEVSVRLRLKSSTDQLPIEIFVAHSLTFVQLDLSARLG